MFLLIAVGYGLKRIGKLPESAASVMNNLVFLVFLPAMLFGNIYHTELQKAIQPDLILFAVAAVLAVFFLALALVLWMEKSNPKRGVMVQGMFRSNFVILGLPLVAALFGQQEVGVTTVLVAIVIPLFNVLAVISLEMFRHGRISCLPILRGIGTNPLILASCLGILVLLSGLRLPIVLESAITSLGSIATPLALVVLGASFHFEKVKGNRRNLIVAVAGRLLFVPGLVLPVAVALGFRQVELVSLLALFCSPTAVSSFPMAQQMGGDGELAGEIVVFSSLFSCVTIFLWVFLFKQLGWI